MKFIVTVVLVVLLSLIAEHTVTRVGAQDDETLMKQDNSTAVNGTDQASAGNNTSTANTTEPTAGQENDTNSEGGAINFVPTPGNKTTSGSDEVPDANNNNDTAANVTTAKPADVTTAKPADVTTAKPATPAPAPGQNGTTDNGTAPGQNGTTDNGTAAPGNETQDATSPTKPGNEEDATTVTTEASNALPGTGECNTHFHTASFIGGIVLCGGVVAIIFFAVHIYRKQSENRYHQF